MSDMDSVFDWEKTFNKAEIIPLLNQLPMAKQLIVVLAYGGNYALAEFIQVTYVEHEIALVVIDPLSEDIANNQTEYGAPIFSNVEKMLEEFSDVLTDECSLVCENCATEDDIIIINRLQPSEIFVITDMTGKTGSTAFHYWMDKCVENPPLVSLCCYKGDLEFFETDARTAYFNALGKRKYSMSPGRLSTIIGESDYSAFVLTKVKKTDEFWWPSNKKNKLESLESLKPSKNSRLDWLDISELPESHDDKGLVSFQL